MKETNKNVQYPCRGCKYFNACGDNMRTEYCDGRDTHKEKKHDKHRIKREDR